MDSLNFFSSKQMHTINWYIVRVSCIFHCYTVRLVICYMLSLNTFQFSIQNHEVTSQGCITLFYHTGKLRLIIGGFFK